MDEKTRKSYAEILKKQLIPAMGCTEPVSVAYGAATLRSLLGEIPDQVLVKVSRNIIKNAKSVIVPHTGGLKGIEGNIKNIGRLGRIGMKQTDEEIMNIMFDTIS